MFSLQWTVSMTKASLLYADIWSGLAYGFRISIYYHHVRKCGSMKEDNAPEESTVLCHATRAGRRLTSTASQKDGLDHNAQTWEFPETWKPHLHCDTYWYISCSKATASPLRLQCLIIANFPWAKQIELITFQSLALTGFIKYMSERGL